MKAKSYQKHNILLSGVLTATGLLLIVMALQNYRNEGEVKHLKEQALQVEAYKNDIIRLNESLTTLARRAAVSGQSKWEKAYQETDVQMAQTFRQAMEASPAIYRTTIDRTKSSKLSVMERQAFDLIHAGRSKEAVTLLMSEPYEIQKEQYVHTIERLSVLLKKQMEATFSVESSKKSFAEISFISLLVVLLLSWLGMVRLTRGYQEALIKSHDQLDELNASLDAKVVERTNSLLRTMEELKKTHQDLQTAQNQLLQSEKFSAIGQLAAGIAHEINNPIGFINSNMQTLEEYVAHYTQLLGILNKLEKALKDKDHERVTQVVTSWEKLRKETNFAFIDTDINNLLKESREGAEKIRRIIFDLRAFASPDKGMTDSVNMNSLTESVLNIVNNEIKYKGELKTEFSELPLIICNPQKISQVLVNILINAAQSIKERGFITVKTYAQDQYVCVDIGDTGCGISPENITKIFDPFFTTKPVGTGVGLGLSLSYDIIRKHGGSITFDSKLGQGTTFKVMLPANHVYDSAQL